ncbi:MAG: FG-GAP repeat domain-containing protein [Planctomycetota bacterium]
MNRHHLFYEDLNGDGIKEVISEINGTWNRITVWQADGKALYDANFGPGERIPARNMRDLDIADLDGDGKKEILAATSSGLIVTFDHTCTKIWARRLNDPPTIMKCVIPKPGLTPRIVVGCEDGTVLVLDGQGETIRSGRITGHPTHIGILRNSSAEVMPLLATDQGEIKAFTLNP